MSEDPNAAADDPFEDTDVASMEDILASIRSMIADDGDVMDDLADVPPDITTSATTEQVEAQATEPTLASLERGGGQASDAVAATTLEAVGEDATKAGGVIEDFDIERLFEPPAIDAAPDAPVLDISPEPAAPAPLPRTLPEGEDMDLVKSLMQELTEAPDMPETPLVAIAAPEALSAVPAKASYSGAGAGDSPLELPEDWFAADLDIPEIEVPEADLSAVDVADADPVEVFAEESAVEPLMLSEASDDMDSLLDDILDQTISDAEALDENDGAASAEVDGVGLAGAAGLSALAGATAARGSDLTDLAASIEADADALMSDTVDLSDLDIPEFSTGEVDGDEPSDLSIGAGTTTGDEPVTELPFEVIEDETDEDETGGDAATAEISTHAAPSGAFEPAEEIHMGQAAHLEEIVADEVEMEAGSAFAELNRMVEEKAVFEERGPRIGDLVQEALKPMLKEWLDENLKGIVERAVAKEVKRISSGK